MKTTEWCTNYSWYKIWMEDSSCFCMSNTSCLLKELPLPLVVWRSHCFSQSLLLGVGKWYQSRQSWYPFPLPTIICPGERHVTHGRPIRDLEWHLVHGYFVFLSDQGLLRTTEGHFAVSNSSHNWEIPWDWSHTEEQSWGMERHRTLTTTLEHMNLAIFLLKYILTFIYLFNCARS